MLFVVCCAFSSQMVMPLWVGAVIDDTGLSEAAVGRIGSLEFLAVAAVSVLVALRIQLFPTRRTAALGVALLVIGNVAAAWADRELTLTLARMLCGIGKGLVVAIAASLIVRVSGVELSGVALAISAWPFPAGPFPAWPDGFWPA